MTTSTPPTPPDEPNEAPTVEQPAAAEPPAAPLSEHPAPAEPAVAPQPFGPAGPPPPGQFGPPPQYPQYPFAPRVREPWVNPAKRGVLSAIAVVAALILLGGGVAIGAAAGGGHDGNRHSQQMRQYQGQPGMQLPRNGQNGKVPAGAPGRGRMNGPRMGTVPTATPSPAPSSSHSQPALTRPIAHRSG